jgi:tRNA nucleotidyltransferase/poly(A) polymerase
LKKNIAILQDIPIERIRQELDKMLLHPSNTQALEDLKTIGFLEIFLPELDYLDRYP